MNCTCDYRPIDKFWDAYVFLVLMFIMWILIINNAQIKKLKTEFQEYKETNNPNNIL